MVDMDRTIALHYKERKLDWIVAAICGLGIVLGFVLLVLGIDGSIELVVDAKTLNAKLVNASPGVVMAAFGFAILGIQAWRHPKLSFRDPRSGFIDLHESGPVLILSDELGIKLVRPTDRDPRGDHWYGEPFDSMLNEIAKTPLFRDEHLPAGADRAETGPVSIENTIVPLVAAWSESASYKDENPYEDRSGRKVEINFGGQYLYGQFEGGLTYSGKLTAKEARRVLSLIYTFAKLDREKRSSDNGLSPMENAQTFR